MEHDPGAPAVLVSPHLDDAVCSAWAVLREPGELLLVNVCTGVPEPGVVGAWDRVLGAEDSAALMRERLAEDAEALELAGRQATGLGALDDQYREQSLDPAELRDGLEREADRASALYAPAGIGGHGDHQAAREAVLAISRDSRVPAFLYADIPYAVRFGWPHWVSGEPELAHLRPDARWEEFLATASCPRSALTPRTVALSEDEAALKLRALETYRTQFAALNAGPLDLLRNPRIHRFELLWELAAQSA
jgi:LmbE family N-acetylglucosaminyl deacetylase